MEKYITSLGETTTEFTEKRSRFIATLRHCETEQDAIAFIDEMRSRYWDARHNVFAYSVEKGSLTRFSDDGEPHGTAGKPIFDVLIGSGLSDIAIVVTRYFGGVLLGTGGLVRAYSKSARDVLEGCEKAEMIPSTVFVTECDYTDHQKLTTLIEKSGAVIEDTVFTEKVTIKYVFKNEEIFDYLEKLSENFSARLEAVKAEERICAFKI